MRFVSPVCFPLLTVRLEPQKRVAQPEGIEVTARLRHHSRAESCSYGVLSSKRKRQGRTGSPVALQVIPQIATDGGPAARVEVGIQ